MVVRFVRVVDMRTDHCHPGLSVRITGGKLKGKKGTVRHMPPLGRGYTTYMKKASVELEDGSVELVSPRWMEAA